jgi:hypothetical protein
MSFSQIAIIHRYFSLLYPIIQEANLEDSPSIVDTISHTSIPQFITQQQDIVPARQNLATNTEI